MHMFWLSMVLGFLISLSAQADQGSQSGETPNNSLEERDNEATELYVIYAQDVSVKSQADAINELLGTLVSDKNTIYASEVNRKVNGEDMWTLFWGAPLTASQAEKVKADPNVSNNPVSTRFELRDKEQDTQSNGYRRYSIWKLTIYLSNPQVGSIDKSSTEYDPSLNAPVDNFSPLQERDRGIARQRDAAEEMKFLSQPYNLELRNFNDYVYDGSAGAGVTEFTQGYNIASRVRWLFGQIGGTAAINTDKTDLHPNGHGTCMLDKVAGNKYGVAKKVSPVVVRAVQQTSQAYLDTIRQISADYLPVYNRDPKHARAVINVSWGFTNTALGTHPNLWISELRRLLKELVF
ncbi:MAG: hypothetical protein Q9226_004359 [Calogaya cf. arnoldii]